jgi:hypothetical protein
MDLVFEFIFVAISIVSGINFAELLVLQLVCVGLPVIFLLVNDKKRHLRHTVLLLFTSNNPCHLLYLF